MKKSKRDKYTKVLVYSIVVIFIIGFVVPMFN